MQEDMRLRFQAAHEEAPGGHRDAALRLLAALEVDTGGFVDANALFSLRQAHSTPYGDHPENVRRAVEDIIGDLPFMGIDWQAVEAFRNAHVPRSLRERLSEIIDERLARQGDVPHQPIAPPPKPAIDTPGWWRDRRHLALGATGLATGLEALQRCLMTMRVDECGRVFMHDGEQDRVLIHDPEAVLDAAMEAFAAYFGTEPFPTPAPYHGANINWPVVREAMLKALMAANEASSPKVL
jgi:hypothetical protein